MLIVGLGNTGAKFDNTRHNLGFAALEEFAKKKLGPAAVWEEDRRFKAQILKLGPNLILLRPQTFMNLSGQAVKAFADYFKIDPEEIVVVYDDLDLPLGKIKIRVGGSGAGHHGVESVIASLGSEGFVRVRLGIDPLQGSGPAVLSEHSKTHFDPKHFVLEPFKSNEKPKVKQMIKHSIEALQIILDKGVETAQNQYN